MNILNIILKVLPIIQQILAELDTQNKLAVEFKGNKTSITVSSPPQWLNILETALPLVEQLLNSIFASQKATTEKMRAALEFQKTFK